MQPKKGKSMRVQDVIKSKGSRVVNVPEGASLKDAAKIMMSHRIGALVVLSQDGRLKGLVSEREIVSAVARCGKSALELQVRELTMLGGPVVAPTDSVSSAMEIMTERHVRHLLVVHQQTVVGVISVGDAVKAQLSEKITENLVLQEIAGWPRSAAA
jgi:CBS domain-containing protein